MKWSQCTNHFKTNQLKAFEFFFNDNTYKLQIVELLLFTLNHIALRCEKISEFLWCSWKLLYFYSHIHLKVSRWWMWIQPFMILCCFQFEKNVGVFECQPLTKNQIVKKTTTHKQAHLDQNEIKVNLVQKFSKGLIQNVKGLFHNWSPLLFYYYIKTQA